MPLHGFPHGKHIPKIQQLWTICGRLTQETTLYFHPFAQMALLEEFQTLTSNMRFNLSLAWLNYPNSFTSTTSSSSIPKHDFGIVDGPWPKKKKKRSKLGLAQPLAQKRKQGVEVQFFHSCHISQSYLITFIYSPKNTKISPINYFGPPLIFLIPLTHKYFISYYLHWVMI